MNTKINLAIIGSRTYNNFAQLDTLITKQYPPGIIGKIISGGAGGADTLAERFAVEHNIPLMVHRPNWDRYGEKAAWVRNQKIINDCTHLVAFWDGSSPGTKMTLDLARKRGGIEITVHYV